MIDDVVFLIEAAMDGVTAAAQVDDAEQLDVASTSFTFRGTRYLLQITELRGV